MFTVPHLDSPAEFVLAASHSGFPQPQPTGATMLRHYTLLLATIYVSGCITANGAHLHTNKPTLEVFKQPTEPPDPPTRPAAPAIIIHNATVMTAAGQVHEPGYVTMKNGLIDSVGPGDGPKIDGAQVIDAQRKFVTPGLIDTHSHLGVYSSPSVKGTWDGNEMVKPTTPEVWAEHGFWPQDPGLWRARAGGVTTIQVLPGSANLIGGRSFTAKLHPENSARAMRFPGAPQGLKMACGENPKRVYGKRGGPQTRMGNVAGYRKAFQSAVEYRRAQQKYQRDIDHWHTQNNGDNGSKKEDPPDPPKRDLGLETLVKVLDGHILIHNHCYRADEMHIMLDLAKEFGFKIRSFHHALEAYKLRDRLAREDVAVSTWADWYGFKMEALDGIPQNAAMVSAASARAVIHSDSSSDIRHLNQEAIKARAAGMKLGIQTSENDTLRWITANPAWALGIHKKTGTLEAGKMADVVIWSHHPFSVYALAEKTFIDGKLVFDRSQGPYLSDFETGLGTHETRGEKK